MPLISVGASRRAAAAALLPAAALSLTIAAGADAAAGPVTAGQLTWTQANVYDTTAGSTARTFLGHITNPAPGSGSNGSVTGSGGVAVTGPLGKAYPAGVTGTSPRSSGLDGAAAMAAAGYTFAYPAADGTFDPDTTTGTVELTGTVTFAGYPWLGAGAPPAITVVDPQVQLSGTSGMIYASGQGNPAAANVYTRAAGPLFTLDLRDAERVIYADGSRGVRGMVPTLALANVFGSAGQYVPGTSGPDRAPNTWGSFSLRVRTPAAQPAAGPKGDAGPAGPAGPVGPAGRDATAGTAGGPAASRLVAYLRAAPYAGARTRRVVLQRAGRVLATGTVRGAALRLAVRPGASVGAGRYQLRLWGGRALKAVRIG